ncbi:FG-GAP repeat protein [Streptomyces jeddahensis]|uniref:FG-GAP repeat protein n=2 Tax=Streptomyces jeddahensis TaxID=1716141 RepID=A0A177HHU5_9ACTN|nr:FG-GAP repeat protein [Streptomyces jeddahensis]
MAVLVLAGCGEDQHGGGKRRPAPGPAVVTPSASAPVPQGKGGKLPDDVNGDGFPDLQIPVQSDTRVAFVYGSRAGLKPKVRTVLGRSGFGFPPNARTQDPEYIAEVATADLDGDGFPDFVGTTTRERGPAEQRRYTESDRIDPYIAWGTPAGRPKPGRKATRVALPGELAGRGIHTEPAAGDFDGDGHADLALDSGRSVTLLYGPFDRSGRPARTGSRPLAQQPPGRLIADRTAPGRATGLVVKYGDDGEQSGSLYFPAGAGGIAPTGRELRAGNALAFGDFDGDGSRDLAVADDGSRNDEPGYESEGPSVHEMVTVYFGGSEETVDFRVPGSRGLAAADTDGDGRDELAVAANRRPRSSGFGQELTEVFSLDRSGVKDRHKLQRTMPARVDGAKVRKSARRAWLYAGTDLNADGKDEIVLSWGVDSLFALYGQRPTHWWITDGRSDLVVFTTLPYMQEK